jgi:hypothetical protein
MYAKFSITDAKWSSSAIKAPPNHLNPKLGHAELKQVMLDFVFVHT